MSKSTGKPAGARLPAPLSMLLAAALLASSWGGAARAQRAAAKATVDPKISEAVAGATAEVLQETSELRKLPVLRQVRSGAQSREEIRRMVVQNLEEQTTPEEMRATESALRKYGLAPAGFKLREFVVGLLTEQIAGYYDPRRQVFYLADWIDVDGQKPVIAHELTHALQDQHFNLRRFEKWPDGDADAELAAHALIEGDATLLMMHYVLRNPLRAFAMMKSMAASGASTEQLDRAPRALRETLMFPYEQGSMFARQVHRRGGWELVSKAYAELPQSTEQILHPEKYFAREAPVKIQSPNLAARLGANWKRTDYDVNGEWGYYLILNEFLPARDEALKAAAGWAGDRYALYEDARAGGVALAQMTQWDTEQDAAEFFDAYARRTEQRYQGATAEQTADAAQRRAWQTKEGLVVLERRGARVAILEGIGAKANPAELLKALWQ